MDDFNVLEEDFDISDSGDISDSEFYGYESENENDAEGNYSVSNNDGEHFREIDENQEQEQENEQTKDQQHETLYTIDDIYDLIVENTAAIDVLNLKVDAFSENVKSASESNNLVLQVIMGTTIMFFASFVVYLFLRKF